MSKSPLLESGSKHQADVGFTLIELSIVLVIIGLLTGSILIGRQLIEAAQIRATLKQVEDFNSALNTFKIKYQALPGDIEQENADSKGFFALTTASTVAMGDGNGLIEGGASGYGDALGETLLFWRHLSESRLVGGTYGQTIVQATGAPSTTTVTDISSLLPQSKLSTGGNYFAASAISGKVYLSLSGIENISAAGVIRNTVNQPLTPNQAFQIDQKIDDGSADSGRVGSALSAGLQVTMPIPPVIVTVFCTTQIQANPPRLVYNAGTATGDAPSCLMLFGMQ